MKVRGASAWHVVLTDLALILFLTTLAASGGKREPGEGHIIRAGEAAIYREGAGGLSLAQWLDEQPTDPRLQLTVQARYAPSDFDRIAEQASGLAREAAGHGFKPRISLEPGAQSEVHVTLAYDTPPGQSQAQTTRLRPDSLAR